MSKLTTKLQLLFALGIVLLVAAAANAAQRQMEKLDRGLVAVKVSNGVFLSWRILGTEWSGVSYNIYRGGTKIASTSSTAASNYTDTSGTTSSTYYITAVVGGVEQAASATVTPWADFYKEVPLQIPAGLTMPDGSKCTYSPNDCSVGDLDGDGEYEIVVKWDPSNSKDNSQSGYTGNVYLDAYKLNGTRLWRIDLGKNIRAGAHYTQFMVYDLDGDGKAEVACKTAPGTKDGTGNYLSGAAAGTDNNADYRNSGGYILTGPEYLTIFNGQTGKELQTVNYVPPRGTVSDWGDDYGNRVDRFLACVAYLDGVRPSLVMCRGYYTRCVLAAYDWRNGALTQRWVFDSNNSGYSGYMGQGCHSLCVGDVDGDGYDEIVYGACTIDHDGTGLYTTGLGHGDALHLGVFDPSRSGLQVWQAHEDEASNGNVGGSFRDAKTGAVIWKYTATSDVGRAMVADVDGSVKGCECWVGSSGLYSCTGTLLSSSQPAFDDFGTWWDGTDQRDILSGTTLDNGSGTRLVTFYNYDTATACNGTKATPNLQADILGDWREEVIYHTSDNSKLIIFTPTAPTSRRLYTLMHDPMYRLGIAWQNVGYNQPPDVRFYLGGGMDTPPTPNIYYPTGGGGGTIANGTYNLINRASGLALDNKGLTTNGAPVGLWTKGSSSNLKWVTTLQSDGYYKLSCVTGGLYLDGMGRTTNGAPAGQWTGNSSQNQEWSIVAAGSYYKLVNRTSGLRLDSLGGTTNGAPVGQWADSSSNNQQWSFVAP